MFPFALIDDAVQQMQAASNAVVATTDATFFENVKFPVSMDAPDRVLDHAARDADGIKFSADEFAFKQQTTDNDVSLECWDGQSLAQKFTIDATAGNKIRKVTLTLNRIGGASGSLTVSVHADNVGVPGNLLASSNIVNVSSITTKGNVTFTFASELAVNKNTSYWLVLTNTGSSSYKVVWYCKTASPDAAQPAAVKVGAGAWTAHTDKNMTYILLGYYTTASAELPVDLAVGPEYQAAYFSATADANCSVTIDIKNAATDETVYANLVNGQAVSLNPSNTPKIKIVANLSRDPALTVNPVISAIGFSGRAYPSKYAFIDREFRPSVYSKHQLSKMGLERTSGGLKLLSAGGTLKANSGPGYQDIQSTKYRVTSTNTKATQLYYTDVAITITGFRVKTDSSYFNGGVWLDNAGVPGTQQADLKLYDAPDTGWQWRTVTFDTPIEIPAGTYFHVGLQYYSSGTPCIAYYTTPLDGLHVYANGVIDRTVSFAMDIYGKCESAVVTSEFILPGVKEHGLVYPLAYLPEGAEITTVISDPLTGIPFYTLQPGEKCSLALLSAELFNRIKLDMTISQTLDSPGPVVGLCYTYTGSEMAPEPVKKYKILTYTFGALAEAGNYLTIEGRGKVLAMSITGSTPAGTVGDGHKLTLDNLSAAYYQFDNATVKTTACLKPSFSFDAALATPPATAFEFSEKLSWDLTEHYGSSNGGSITVALEV